MRFHRAIEKFALPSGETAKICPLSPVATKSASAPKARSQMYFDFGSKKTFFRRMRKRGSPCRQATWLHKRAFGVEAIACATRSVDSKTMLGLACRAAFKSGRPLQGTRRRHKAHPSNDAQRPEIGCVRIGDKCEFRRSSNRPSLRTATPCGVAF